MPGALDGLLVVSVEQAVAAPYCSARLADAGARVIKIEPTNGGDPMRGMGGLRFRTGWARHNGARGSVLVCRDSGIRDGRVPVRAFRSTEHQVLVRGAAARYEGLHFAFGHASARMSRRL